jgi:hypothetical protein
LRSPAGPRPTELRLVWPSQSYPAEELLLRPSSLNPPAAGFADRYMLLCAALFLG